MRDLNFVNLKVTYARGLAAALALAAAGYAGAEAQTVTITGAAQPSVVLIKEGGLLKSEAALSIQSDAAFAAWVRITVPGTPAYMESLGNLAAGANTRTVHVAELAAATADVSFQIFTDVAGTGNPLAARSLPQKRIKRWTLYVANDCHVDIGYTTYQENLKRSLYPAYLDTAFDYIDATAAWPVESRFTYPIESSFMIYDGTWISRNADWHETLKGHLRSGRISYPPSYFNFSTETMGSEELARSGYISNRHLRDMLGVAPATAAYMTDNPSLSWSFIDALAESGIKAYRFRFNNDFDKWDIFHYPRLFYLRGRDPAHKVLIWNGGHYMNENANIGPAFGFQGANSQAAYDQVLAWFAQLAKEGYNQDAWLATFTSPNAKGWVDNSRINPNVMERIKGVNDLLAAKGYAYPKVIASNHGDFFDHILAGDTAAIPTFKGDVESWWNLGVPSTAYETGRNRGAQDKLAAAETFASFASAFGAAAAYPQERLTLAWKNLLTWDEHTWGPADRSAGDQWNWKRNTALIGDGSGDDILKASLASLSATVKTKGWSLVVFNPLSWIRDDLAYVPLADLPPRFSLKDAATGLPVRYQVLQDGRMVFQAKGVPGLGYKVFEVTSVADAPRFTGSSVTSANSLENAWFRIAFDAAGNITSIKDKAAGDRELVDALAPAKFNQLQVNEAFAAGPVKMYATAGALQSEMLADGTAGALGVESLQRRVILYDSLPRIDIENSLLKADGGDKWDFHFAFPFSMPGYSLRHEMPTGSLSPAVSPDTRDTGMEQLYSSATDQYAVNRWIDISDGKGYGIAFSALTAPMVSYGGRRAMQWGVGYNHEHPWIWSMIYNNHWHTNFQAVQPGLTRFRYSFRPHGGNDWSQGAPRLGCEASDPLQVSVVKRPQDGPLAEAAASFLPIDQPNVVLATAKLAEDNGEGMILRFNEIEGRNTQVTVDVSRLAASGAGETDLIENDRGGLALAGGKLSFAIHAFGWKTVRLRRGTAPAAVAGLSASILADGCRLAWTSAPAAYWEVFRGTQADFTAGSGSYLGVTERPQFFDPQVVPGLKRSYWYRVRAAGGGAKASASPSIQATAAAYTDKTPPTVPALVKVERLHGTRASLEWRPSLDDKAVTGYEVWRDGQKLITVEAILNSHLDIYTPAANDLDYNQMAYYQVLAFDKAGNRSALSPRVTSGPALPDWLNLAPAATLTVSSEFDQAHSKDKASDGITGLWDEGEWVSKGETNPWAHLEWKEPQAIRGVVLYDRSNAADNLNGGLLTFSDGSSLRVTGLATWGEARLLTFPWKSVTWVRFQAEGGTGTNGGLAEFMVLGDDRVPVSISKADKDAAAWRTRAGEGGIGNSNGGRKHPHGAEAQP